jgi:hypothetical protein
MRTEPPTTPAAVTPAEPATRSTRRIVFVAGSGRSGTSTLSGALQQLGMHVPTPEVPPDESNPKGFAESQWVVDLHDQLLRRTGVHVSDARPQAWFDTAKISLKEQPRTRLHRWLEGQFSEADELLIKDPRLAWFLGLWQVSAVRSGAEPAFVTMLRPPAEVVRSKERHYAGRLGNAGRATAWLNMMLHTERATRGSGRAFLRYHDLLTDWTSAVYQLGETFDLQVIKQADTPDISRVHDFIDPTLHRSGGSWDDLDVPVRVRDLAEETWQQLTKLVDTPEAAGVTDALDELRIEYTAFYAEAEAVARSSIIAERLGQTARADRAIAEAAEANQVALQAAKRSATKADRPGPRDRAGQPRPRKAGRRAAAPPTPSRADRIAGRVPHSIRSMVPGKLRRRARALLDRWRPRR